MMSNTFDENIGQPSWFEVHIVKGNSIKEEEILF